MKSLDEFLKVLQKELNFETGGRVKIVNCSFSKLDDAICVRLSDSKKDLSFIVDGYFSNEFISGMLDDLFRKAITKETRYTIKNPEEEYYFIYGDDVIYEIIKRVNRKENWVTNVIAIQADSKITSEELFELVKEESGWNPATVIRESVNPVAFKPNKAITLKDRIMRDRLMKVFRQYNI